MKAAVVQGYGSHQTLAIAEVALPTLGDSDVLIAISAASLNPIDFKIRNGDLRRIRRHQFPLILGHDLAGQVIAVGKSVRNFKVGDEVYSRPRNERIGTLAEQIAVHEDEVALKPKSLSFEEAASIPLVGLTSLQALRDIAKLQPGQNVFIHAGSGGIGTFAIQLAKALGATVATTSTNETLVKSLGADVVVNYRSERFEQVLPKQDVILDSLGGEALDRSFGILKSGGHLVSIAGMPDHKTAHAIGARGIPALVMWWMGRKLNQKASRVGAHYHFIFMKPLGSQLEEISALIDGKKIRPVIDRIFSLNEAEQAMKYLESGRAKGKVVVRI